MKEVEERHQRWGSGRRQNVADPKPDWDGPLGITIAECQALLQDNPPDVLARVNAELEGDRLLRAMYDIGYFPKITPPGGR